MRNFGYWTRASAVVAGAAVMLAGTAAVADVVSISTAGAVVRTASAGRQRAPRPALAMAIASSRPAADGPAAAAPATPGPAGATGDAATAAAILRAAMVPAPAPSPAVVNPWLAPTMTLPDPGRGPELGFGDEGPQVAVLERRLGELGYRPGEPDGFFDDDTWSAVLAFQKAENLERNGWVDPATWARLAAPRAWRPSNAVTYPRVEVDLERQVVLVVFGPRHIVTLNTSTGGGYTYTNQYGTREVAETPVGVYRVYRTVDAYDIGPLGALYRPMYFLGGYALHGAPYVPDYPDSHGCVRLSNADMDWMWDQHPGELPVVIHETMDPGRFYPGSGGAGAAIVPAVPATAAPAVPA